MKYSEKVQQYLSISAKEAAGTKLSKEEAQKMHALRRELAAKGLDPQHPVGLSQRALIMDHKAKVANYVALRDTDKRLGQMAVQLAEMGIKPDKQQLSRILREFDQNAKAISKKKTARCANPSRQYADQKLAELEAEMAAEEADADPAVVDAYYRTVMVPTTV